MASWILTVTDTDGLSTVTEWDSYCYAKQAAQNVWNFDGIIRVTLEHGDAVYVVCPKGYITKIL